MVRTSPLMVCTNLFSLTLNVLGHLYEECFFFIFSVEVLQLVKRGFLSVSSANRLSSDEVIMMPFKRCFDLTSSLETRVEKT